MGMLLMGAFTALCLGFLLSGAAAQGQGRCTRGCDLALASYYIWPGSNLTFIGQMMSVPIPRILNYNPQIADPNLILAGSRINVPFSCDCIGGQFLGHVFNFSTFTGVTYTSIAQTYYSNLTTVEAMMMYNTYEASRIPDTGVSLNVTVNCSCGDASVSRDYGLFITYTLRPGDTLESVAAANNLTAEVVRSYNPTLNFSAGAGVAFIPGNQNGTFPTLSRGGQAHVFLVTIEYQPLCAVSGLSPGAIAGISVAVVGGVFFVAGTLFLLMQRRKHAKHIQLQKQEQQLLQTSQGPGRSYSSGPDSSRDGAASGVTGFPLQKSLEFSYKDLANVTNNFSIEYKIGEGGFGAVYYAELHGEKAAIKKMDMQASKEFLAELKVLTHVHHRNLVRLIGYCVEGSLFLVYEYIENGNLSQNLRGSGRRPLSWSERVQIALDSARGLEYIHEHTVPVYVHRDIKPANILIDQNYNGKVADFGLTKLTDIGNSSLPTGLVGTFGYMSPEYAQFGDVSPKVDVYAFGVVLYELISAKEAIVKSHDSVNDSRGLVALFDEALNSPDPSVEMQKLVDPRLGNSYPLDSVQKMAQLAKACTHENPQQRPPMRSIVVTLMSLSSSTDDWDVSAFNGNQGLLNLMSGR